MEKVILIVNRQNAEMVIVDIDTYYQTKTEHVFIHADGDISALPAEKYSILETFYSNDNDQLPIRKAENFGDVPKSLEKNRE